MNFGGIQAWPPITGLIGHRLSEEAEQQMLCFGKFEIRDILLIARWLGQEPSACRQAVSVVAPPPKI